MVGIIFMFTAGSAALAYNDAGYVPICKWDNGPTVQVNWRWGPSINTSGYWANGFRLASDAWTQAGTKVRMGYSSTAESTADVYFYYNGLDGENLYYCHNPQWWRMAYNRSYGNVAYVFDSAGFYDRIKQVAAHELGHSLALGHSNSWAVMGTNAPTNIPTSDDVAGLNSLYP